MSHSQWLNGYPWVKTAEPYPLLHARASPLPAGSRRIAAQSPCSR
ncbi:Uncharacterised protein [Vibrio cholerae]|nr:Uncharacterised protein [Vibrio cholerae]CSI57870.1 Uncharacterised protein [Vibrio cholerae]